MKRREFLSVGTIGATAALGSPWTAAIGQSQPGLVNEPAKRLPVAGDSQVIVCVTALAAKGNRLPQAVKISELS
jgi:hypothetical protein